VSHNAILPRPPTVGHRLPRVGAGLSLLRDPVSFLSHCRREQGDTFALDAFGYRLMFVFSPEGVRNLWALAEKVASKGLADFALLRHKVPDDLFVGRRTVPHALFARDDVHEYLARELVTMFGHGRPTCPAMRFSIESIRLFATRLLERFDLEPRFSNPAPLRRQIGGVARADRPCVVRDRRAERADGLGS
jgi:hypothetical protein